MGGAGGIKGEGRGMCTSIKLGRLHVNNGSYIPLRNLYQIRRSNVADGDYGSHYCEVWNSSGRGLVSLRETCMTKFWGQKERKVQG